MKALCIVAAAILMTATGAAAADSDGGDDAKKEKKICRTEKMTGSRTRSRRICLTREEWDRLAESTRRSVGELERNANRTQAAGSGS